MNDPILHPTADRLQAFTEETLAEAERAVVASHVQTCEACQGEVEEWRSLFSVLATLPHYDPSPHFADLVMSGVTLPDPWYVRAAARVSAQLQVFTPKTSRAWAFAGAAMSMPIMLFGALTMWLLSKPYVTPQSLYSFAAERLHNFASGTASNTMASVLQSNLALYAFRALARIADAGLGTAGALALGIAMLIALSAWFLYQTLFRKTTKREDHDYASYCF